MSRRVCLGFAVLCLLAGSAPLFDEAFPGTLSGLSRTATHDGLLAIVFGLASRWERRETTPSLSFWVNLAFVAALIFSVPQVLFAAAGGHVSRSSGALVFLLVPAGVIFAVAQRAVGFGAEENPLRLLGPALAGVGGAALLFPFDWPGSMVGQLWLAALVASAASAAVGAVRMHDLLQGVPFRRAATAISSTLSIAALSFSSLDRSGMPSLTWSGAAIETVRCLFFDGPILLLTVWLLREMKPIPFSSRLLWIPVVSIIESFLLLRPSLTWITAGGFVLLAGSALALVRVESSEMLSGQR